MQLIRMLAPGVRNYNYRQGWTWRCPRGHTSARRTRSELKFHKGTPGQAFTRNEPGPRSCIHLSPPRRRETMSAPDRRLPCQTGSTGSAATRTADKSPKKERRRSGRLKKIHSDREPSRCPAPATSPVARSVERFCKRSANPSANVPSVALNCTPASNALTSIPRAGLSVPSQSRSAFRARTSATNAPSTPSAYRSRKRLPRRPHCARGMRARPSIICSRNKPSISR